MAKKKRKSRVTKFAAVPLLALPLILNPCVARDEKKDIEDRHIETHQNRESTELVGHVSDMASASTATFTTGSHFIFPEQYI
jgi:hypothetical protein